MIRDRIGSVIVYAMLGLSLFYVPFELFGPLQFKSLQVENGADPITLAGLTTGQLGLLILFPANLYVLYLLSTVLREGKKSGVVQKQFRWNIRLSWLTALLATFVPMAMWYYLLPPVGWVQDHFLFVMDCVVQGRLWWGIILLALGSLYSYQHTMKFHPEQLQP